MSLFGLPRTVLVLGAVSFLNDTASDMIAPLLPLFLTATLGAGPAIVGLVEGVAEATASLLKLLSGRLADRGVPPKALVLGGYGLSNTVRPLLGLAWSWGWALALRFLDRVGKGLRSAPRDALIAAATTPALRGRAFGLHRALDNAGAMLGPLLAFLLLDAGLSMEAVFLASAVPGVLLLALLLWGLPSHTRPPVPTPPPLRWSALEWRLRRLLAAAGLLALGTAPEAFLVLWAQQQGLAVAWIPLIWAAASGVKALIAAPAGSLSDRLGRLPVLLTGWGGRTLLLATMAFATPEGPLLWLLFLAYAAALAFTEGAERALVGDVASPAQRATAFGLFHMITGLAALPGAVLFGALWQWGGMHLAFLTSAGLTLVAAVWLLRLTVDEARGC